MPDCIFCKIISGEAPATVVFETESDLGIVPLNFVAKGYTLLIPKKHFENLSDIGEDDLRRLIVDAKSLTKDLLNKNSATGINILHASGKDAQQSISHFHFHLIPRYPNDGLDLWIKNRL